MRHEKTNTKTKSPDIIRLRNKVEPLGFTLVPEIPEGWDSIGEPVSIDETGPDEESIDKLLEYIKSIVGDREWALLPVRDENGDTYDDLFHVVYKLDADDPPLPEGEVVLDEHELPDGRKLTIVDFEGRDDPARLARVDKVRSEIGNIIKRASRLRVMKRNSDRIKENAQD